MVNLPLFSAKKTLPLLLSLTIALLMGSSLLAKESFNPDEQMVYKTVGETKLLLHVFKPEGHHASDKRPAAVFFHGGGWSKGSPSQFHPFAQHLADQGMVALAAQYRLTKQEGVDVCDCVADGKSAIRWVRQHADELGIDPDRITAGGGSAGGQIAAATGNVKLFDAEGENHSISSQPNALILFNPVANNSPNGFGHGGMKTFWRDMSPLHNIGESSPPTLLMNGRNDHLVPVEDIKECERRMQEAGRCCDVRLYQGAGHAFFNYKKPSYESTVADIDTFLQSLGYID